MNEEVETCAELNRQDWRTVVVLPVSLYGLVDRVCSGMIRQGCEIMGVRYG